MTATQLRYKVGIDVGTHSVGLSAVECDEHGAPVSLLSSTVVIHDSGIDPDGHKQAVTRQAASGVARRERRRRKRERKLYQRVDAMLRKHNLPVMDARDVNDMYAPWRARVRLVAAPIDDIAELSQCMSLALRYIVRHRGWRNPYTDVSALYDVTVPSEACEAVRTRLAEALGVDIPETATVGQIIGFAQFGRDKLRGTLPAKHADAVLDGAVLSERLHQSDHARDITEICRVQSIDEVTRKEFIDVIFHQASPRGGNAERVGTDPLQPHLRRALKSSTAFQQYRIAAMIGNLRIYDHSTDARRVLDVDEFNAVYEYLLAHSIDKQRPTWDDIAAVLDISREDLSGMSVYDYDDGTRVGGKGPSIDDVAHMMATTSYTALRQWWSHADVEAQALLVRVLSNDAVDDAEFAQASGHAVDRFLAQCTGGDREQLEKLNVPSGRAAYSEDTLSRLTARMLAEGCDLYTARRLEFGIGPDWCPPAPAIGVPLGNPAGDRVVKIVARWLGEVTRAYGTPECINVEHVRGAFDSERVSREYQRDVDRAAGRNDKLREVMREELGIEGTISRSMLYRYQAYSRQQGTCAYCGGDIHFSSCEMDHIVPQAGPGSTNIRDNLVAVCHRCNAAKSNIPFATWAATCGIDGVSVDAAIDRVKAWDADTGMRVGQFKAFQSRVIARLKRTRADAPEDVRSMESVAWMANELHRRIKQEYSGSGTTVGVYRGAITASARRTSGMQTQLLFIDGAGKSRLDRRHHAVDAAVVALMQPYVSEVLAQRESLRWASHLTGGDDSWKQFTGDDIAHQQVFARWLGHMDALCVLLQDALDTDTISVTRPLRLRPGNAAAHKDTVRPMVTKRVGDALPAAMIRASVTPAQWCALTRHPDFDPKLGLVEDNTREIRLHDRVLSVNDTVSFFNEGGSVQAGVAVRGGWAAVSRFHHVRLYRITTPRKHGDAKTSYGIVRVYDVDAKALGKVDVFAAPLAPQSLTMRYANAKVTAAIAEGRAEYLGWMVPGDEVCFEVPVGTAPAVDTLQDEYGVVTRWVLTGFESDLQLTFKPALLSGEGLGPSPHKHIEKLLHGKGFVVSVNTLFKVIDEFTVVRRTTLGKPRHHTGPAHLPACWGVDCNV